MSDNKDKRLFTATIMPRDNWNVEDKKICLSTKCRYCNGKGYIGTVGTSLMLCIDCKGRGYI